MLTLSEFMQRSVRQPQKRHADDIKKAKYTTKPKIDTQNTQQNQKSTHKIIHNKNKNKNNQTYKIIHNKNKNKNNNK
jgi:hypothetical protein